MITTVNGFIVDPTLEAERARANKKVEEVKKVEEQPEPEAEPEEQEEEPEEPELIALPEPEIEVDDSSYSLYDSNGDLVTYYEESKHKLNTKR
jgi:hypothetical protein